MDKNLLVRVRLLNVAIALLLIYSFSNSFIRGYNEGKHSAEIYKTNNVSGSLISVDLRPTDSLRLIPFETKRGTAAYLTIEKANVYLSDSNMPTSKVVADFLIILAALGIIVWLIILTWKITNSLIRGQILISKNIRRVRSVGVLLIVKQVLYIIFQYVDYSYMNSILEVKGYRVVLNLSYSDAIFGLIMLVFAEIMVVANRIREEQELTI